MSKSLEKSLFWPIKPCISPLSRKMHTLKMLFFPVFYLKYFGTFFLLIRHIAPQKEGHIYSTRFTTTTTKKQDQAHTVSGGSIFLDFYQTHATGAYYNSAYLTHPTHATVQAFYMQAGTGLTSFLLSSTLLSLVKLTPFFFLVER